MTPATPQPPPEAVTTHATHSQPATFTKIARSAVLAVRGAVRAARVMFRGWCLRPECRRRDRATRSTAHRRDRRSPAARSPLRLTQRTIEQAPTVPAALTSLPMSRTSSPSRRSAEGCPRNQFECVRADRRSIWAGMPSARRSRTRCRCFTDSHGAGRPKVAHSNPQAAASLQGRPSGRRTTPLSWMTHRPPTRTAGNDPDAISWRTRSGETSIS